MVMRNLDPKACRWSIIVLLSAALGACANLPRTEPSTEITGIGDAETIAAIAADSDDTGLTRNLEQLDSEFQRLLTELRERHNLPPEKVETLQEGRDLIERFTSEKTSAIRSKYEEYSIDFLELNRWKLRPAGRAQLAAIDWKKACDTGRVILIYGYGDPIGLRSETEKISAGRAREIANWIINHSSCKPEQLVDRGLGIDLKAEAVARTSLSPEERRRIFERSRYARIFVPK